MAIINKKLSEKNLVTPMGTAKWVKVNTRYDEYEGKRKYMLDVFFEDKAVEAQMKKVCDDFLTQAKASKEFEGKKWRPGNDRCGYTEQDDGTLLFHFWTHAFYTDKQTGEEKQKFIPCYDVKANKPMDNTVAIGDGSKVRVLYAPAGYWGSKDANGVSLYLVKLAVDDLVVYGGSNDFSEFGITNDAESFLGDDEEVPI